MSVKRLFSYSIYRSLTKCRPFSTTIPRALASAKEPTKPKLARLDSIQSNTPYHFYQSKVLDEYISQPINASTLRDFIFFGRQMNTSRLLKSANWVHNELLVRLAHRIRDFQQLPFFVGKNTHIEFVYRLYWGAFETLRQFPTIKNQDDNVRFCQVLKSLLEDGLLVVPQLAQGLSESATYYAPDQNDLDLFLNRMLRSRISRRILAEQHLALTEACEDHFDNSMGFGDGYVGIIYVHCSAKELVERAKALVNQHVERYCHQTDISEDWKPPTIEVTLQQDHTTANNGRDEIVFAYVSIFKTKEREECSML